MMTSTANVRLDFTRIKRVLVTKLRFHGDVLLSSPVFQTLKNHYPHLEVDALVYKETQDMLSFHPAISRIFTIDKQWRQQNLRQQLTYEQTLLRQLRKRHYDLLIHLTEHWRGLYLKYLLTIPYAVTAQYPRRQHNWFWQHGFTHIYPIPRARHKAASHIDALRYLGINADVKEEQTSLAISPEDQQYVQQLLNTFRPENEPYILIHPTSRFFYKCWPPHTMAQYINRLTEYGYNIVVTAAPDKREMAYIDNMAGSLSAPVANLAGQLTLKQLAAAIQQSGCFVGVDSAPMHMAAAVGTPIVALFGPTNAQVWGPRTDQTTILQSDSTEKPALVNGNRPNDINNCTLDIDIDLVVRATLKRMNPA